MTRAKKNPTHTQRLSVSGLTFCPAKLKQDGTRKTRAATRLKLETSEGSDPAKLLAFVATVDAADLALELEPDDSEAWSGSCRITGATIKPHPDGAPGQHSIAVVSLEVVSDDPQTHLDLFAARLAMDGRDNWEAATTLRMLQADFTRSQPDPEDTE